MVEVGLGGGHLGKAEVAEGGGEAFGEVAETAGAMGALHGRWLLALMGEEGEGLPGVDEGFDALGFEELDPALIGVSTLLAVGGVFKSEVGADEDEAGDAIGAA